jgi:hypothetical protein
MKVKRPTVAFRQEQAMADYVMLLRYDKLTLLYRPRGSYCPVITIGASYPGFFGRHDALRLSRCC